MNWIGQQRMRMRIENRRSQQQAVGVSPYEAKVAVKPTERDT